MPIDERLIVWSSADDEETKRSKKIDARMVKWEPVKEKESDPSAGGGTLSFGPIDTGIRTPEWLDRGLSGAGKAFVDSARGAGQWLGLVSRDDVKEARKYDKPLMDTTAGTVGNFFGNAAQFAPAALIPGANTILGSALVGAGSGLVQPSASTGETFGNVALGGAAGAAVPAAIRGVQVARSMLDPFSQSGRDRIVGSALRSAAGNEADDVARALESARPRVPGSQPTVAELANNPGLAALQRTATAINPQVANDVAARQLANNEARILAVQGMAPDRVASVAAREAAVEPLYAQAKAATVALTPEMESLINRPVMQEAMRRAQTLAKNNGESLDLVKAIPEQAGKILGMDGAPMASGAAKEGSMSGKAAHYLKMALDDLSNASPATGIAGNELRAIQGTRAGFLSELERQVPAYGQARTTYAQMSKPITQADIAEELLKRSTGNIQGAMTPAAFNRAMSDNTARSVTGQANATLAGALTPEQMSTLNAVRSDLQALDFSRNAGRGVGSDTVQKLAYTNMLNEAGVPSFIRNMGPTGLLGGALQKAAQIAYKSENDKMAEQLARAMLTPEMTAELMKKAATRKGLLALEEGLKRAGVGLSVPGLLTVDAQ